MSEHYQSELRRLRTVGSKSRAGQFWGHAEAKSAVARMKQVLWHHRSFADAVEAERAVFEHIEVFCNRERLRSSLGYLSPATFESQQPTHTVNES